MKIANESANYWDDDHFQDRLTALLVFDPIALRVCSPLLVPEDFKPLRATHFAHTRYVVADRALEHYQKHHEPLGKLLRADVLDYAAQLALGSSQVNKLQAYVEHISQLKVDAPSAITDKVVRYKSERLKAVGIQEMVEFQSTGMLTDEKLDEIYNRMRAAQRNGNHTVNYMETMDDRIARRRLEMTRDKIPWTFIDPLDSMIHCVGPKQLGAVIAPYKRGKSQFLLWIAVAYALQRLNVLYITLEDKQSICEDRLDAITTHVPVKRLNEFPQTLTKRFDRFRKMVNTNIEIYDGTEGGITVPVMERILLAKREEGFRADSLIVDYDEEITPVNRYKDKWDESDDVYRALRQLCSKYNLVGWTAAQTQRDTRHMKILSGDRVAKDIGKLKKVTCGLSLGKGDWTDTSIYIWVAAHKEQRMEIGCEICTDFERSLVYDREETRKQMRLHAGNP